MSGWRTGVVVLLAGAAAVACSSLTADAMFAGDSNSDGGAGAGASPSGNFAPASATGAVLVHAASFPAFRLCFSNHPELPPLPDAKAMPQANVVGVEVGSVVRVDPMDAPGEVYVIDERQARSTAGIKDTTTCGELICTTGSKCLRKNLDYNVANSIALPVGKTSVEVLAVTGCGSQGFLDTIGASSTDCGASWSVSTGNLTVKSITLSPGVVATTSSIPAQVVHMSPLLAAQPSGASLDVVFGPLDAGASQVVVAHDPPLFSTSLPVSLPVDQTDLSIYGKVGLKVATGAGADAGDAGATVVVQQSLAAIQALSSPTDVPNEYYLAASNYVFFLLGDPRVTATLSDGGANPAFDPRLAMHILAIPVVDPNAADASAADAQTDH